MWQALSDEARRAVRELCAAHGPRLYDYCRTELAASGAEQAVAGTLLTAHLYADRLGDPALRRAWFYALARAHRAVAAEPASIGSWSRPGRMSELLPEALLSLDRPHRELLDLSVRHGLADSELALIFELRAEEVRAVVTRAARGLEGWFAAVIAARAGDGCPELAARVDAWLAAPGRRARARIGRHIPSCDACRTAPRTVSAGALLRRLPMAIPPDTLVERLESAAPLPGEGPMWRADGFPAQARLLPEPALPPFPAASEPAVPPFPAVPELAGAGAGGGMLSAPVAEELLDSPVADPRSAAASDTSGPTWVFSSAGSPVT
ncbi:hypothetical protein AB0L05_41925, partial [Nonomuraea pusilla]|uniref:RNA polymerase sigma factor n=1 Tax=Nonomuraea pusilla TaxID=46177 RepID=UPI00348F7D6F